jgi:predicted transcriptional regulator
MCSGPIAICGETTMILETNLKLDHSEKYFRMLINAGGVWGGDTHKEKPNKKI